jgi:CheY-like chemotaxis protein
MHGGTIRVSSRGRSYGTTGTVSLKCYLGAVTTSASGADAEGTPSRLRILLVEDHLDTQRILARMLTNFGHEISIANNVAEAQSVFRSQALDVILSDIGLPDGTGYDIISEAKKTTKVKGVALTGYGMSEDVRRSKEAGFDFHLTKPIDVSELRTVLRKLNA